MSRSAYIRFLKPQAMVGLIAGYLVWSLCFVVLYSLLSVGCELAWHHVQLLGINLLSWLLLLVWLLHVAAVGALVWRVNRSDPAELDRPGRFMRHVTLLLHATAFVGTIWIGFPVLGLPPCA